MRLLRVGFEPFGALRGTQLDFGAAPGRVHVVWGPNEAGKSTALRGILAFLFGIEHRSADQHERGVELRVRARIEVEDGRVLDLVRRKGKKDPLRDGETDAGVPERELSRWLGGIDEATFRQLHALDHAALRAGGESIVRGEGRLGELMVEATTGTTGFAQRLAALREEADALYRPRAKSTGLAVAVEAWKAASSAMKQASLAPSAWLEQERGIASTRARIADAEQRLREARVELARLEKLVALEAPFTRLRHRRARRARLGDVADVAEGTSARHGELAQELSQALDEAERADVDLARLALEREAAARRAAEAPAELDRSRASELRRAIEALDRAIAEGGAEIEEIARARAEALEALAEPPDGAAWTARTVDARDLARVQACAAARRDARVARAAAERALAEAASRADAVAPDDPEADDVGALAAAIAAGRRASVAADALGALETREIEVRRRVAAGRAVIGDAPEGARDRVPDDDAIDREITRRADEVTRFASLEHDRRGAAERLARADAQIDALRGGGAPPTESELATARAERDAAMERAFAAIDASETAAARSALRAAERAQRGADAIADRMRHEAAHVEQIAAAEAERARASDAARVLDERASAARAAADAGVARFAEAWPAVARVPVDRLRSWLGTRADVRAATEELAAIESRKSALRAELGDAAAHLARVGLDDVGALSKASFDAAVASAEARLDDRRVAARRREERAAERARAESDRRAREQAFERARADEAEAGRALEAALARHGLGPTTTEDEAVVTVVALATATRETRRHERAMARVERLRAEQRAAEIAWREATDCAGLADVPADEVLARAERAREGRAELPRIDEAIAQRRESAARARTRADRARARLDEIVARAGVPAELLVAAEERAGEARSVQREVTTLEATLVELTQAPDLATAEATLSNVDFSRAADEAEQLLRDVEGLEASRTRDLHDLGAQLAALEEMERGEGRAADLAESAEAHLARARDLARRAAVARVAVALLEQEVERHRAEREGPVLRRAGALFHTLTAGRWEGLRIGEDDAGEPQIRCVGPERELGVKELSEGTVDQLYLALRLAALEHHARAGAPLPLILDDVLVHSDDERTAAALVALADVAKTVQVLLFTHERHVVEIAERVLPASARALHELTRPG